METRHAPSHPDTMARLHAPLNLGFPDGQALRITDWSLHAVYSPDLAGRPLEGLMLSIPFQGVSVYFPVELEPGAVAGEYLFRNLTGRERATLALLHRNLLAGRTTPPAEMMAALDTPAVAAAASRPLNLLRYLLAAAVLAGGLAGVAWWRGQGVPVLAAHVTVAGTDLTAPVAGFVRELPAAVGQRIAAGTILARLDDPEALRLLAEAEAAEAEALTLLAGAETRLASHMETATTARAQFRGGAERFDQGISVASGDFHDIRQRLAAEVAAQQVEVARAQARLAGTRDRAEATAMTAPTAGHVTAHHTRPFEMVRPGDLLLSFEPDQPRSITAWIAQDQVLRVWPGMAARITVMRNGRPEQLAGTVTTLRSETAGTGKAILATIAIGDLDAEASRALLSPGQPVQVVLSAQSVARSSDGDGSAP